MLYMPTSPRWGEVAGSTAAAVDTVRVEWGFLTLQNDPLTGLRMLVAVRTQPFPAGSCHRVIAPAGSNLLVANDSRSISGGVQSRINPRNISLHRKAPKSDEGTPGRSRRRTAGDPVSANSARPRHQPLEATSELVLKVGPIGNCRRICGGAYFKCSRARAFP